ncbi:DUF3040 domain-containing protein [Pseudonocardia thermophila]|jgi:Protein of unknown function (DUF3040).|nr:DUF3040 domain-containing protein [Pseudonocardia thermophila]
MLSERERRALEEIAAHMEHEDPEFCRKLAEPLEDAARARRRRWTVLAGAGIGVGFLAAVVGVLAMNLLLVFVGCLVAATSWGAIAVLHHALPADDGVPPTGWTWA